MYIEVAVGSPRKRGLLIPLDTLPDLIYNEGKENAVYRSTYLYYEDALEYRKLKGTLKDFLGLRGIDWIPIDIDKKDNTDEYTLDIVRGLVYDLEDYGAKESNYCIYFSGTGYHVMLHAGVFGLEPSRNLPYIVKETIKSMFDYVDLAVYMRTSIYRCDASLNQKSGLYKIPLDKNEIFNKEPKDIKLIAKERIQTHIDWEDKGANLELKDKIVTKVPEIRTLNNVTEPSKFATCIQTMYKLGPVKGERNNTVLRLASHYRKSGLTSDAAKASIMHWNNEALDQQVVLQKVEDTYNRGYNYKCHDELMSKYCNPKCVYYKRKDYSIDISTAADLQKSLEERFDTDFSGRVLQLPKLLGLGESVDCDVYPGELMTIFGSTGSSKTTLAQNLALGYNAEHDIIDPELQIPTLFLSLELSEWYMHRRHLQIVSDRNKKEVTSNFKGLWGFHKNELRHLNITTVSPNVEQIAEMIRKTDPRLVVVDYIDLVEPPRHIRGEYETIRYISHHLSNMAVNMDLIIIQISQTSRSYSREQIMDMYAGKGSGAIENASRKVLGITGTASESTKKLELFKNSDGDLFNNHYLEWTPSFRLKKVKEEIHENNQTNYA